MSALTPAHKIELTALISTFNCSGIQGRLAGNFCRYYKLFFGRDYKVLAQLAPFTLCQYLPDQQKKVWIKLSQVRTCVCIRGYMQYIRCMYATIVIGVQACLLWKVWGWACGPVPKDLCRVCASSPDCISWNASEAKIYLLLHLIDSMRDFGPASGFNTERFVTLSNTAKEHYNYACGLYSCRCESYLSLLRHQNIHSNRQAPSRDIAEAFVKLEHLRFVCSGGLFDGRFDFRDRKVEIVPSANLLIRHTENCRCGEGLHELH